VATAALTGTLALMPCSSSALAVGETCGSSLSGEIDLRIAWWDNPTMLLTLDAKRRLTVPAGLAPASPGDAFEARFDAEENEIVFRRIAGAGDWLAVLSECPVSIDDPPRRRREPARRRRI